jgi:hypothetical protein
MVEDLIENMVDCMIACVIAELNVKFVFFNSLYFVSLIAA